jgi:hypothetical protein
MEWKIEIASTPGFYEQYRGAVTVQADTVEEAIDRAFDRLRRGAFPDRGRSQWKVLKAEVVL